LPEFKSAEISIPDVIGFNDTHSILIECKVSHADYLADLKKFHRAVDNPQQCGNYRYYLTLPDIIKYEEVNNGWGLLYYDGKVHVIKPPVLHTEPEIKVAEYSILYSLARRIALKGLMKNALTPFRICDFCGEVAESWHRKFGKNFCEKCWDKKD
jgi:hypothetical protein